jgi:hypothetical protein
MFSNWQVVIAERGWVYVGRVSRDGDHIVITDCYNVRRWGTERGLGELALEGPRGETQLDYYGTVRVHVLACSGVECDPKIWDAWLAKSGRSARK